MTERVLCASCETSLKKHPPSKVGPQVAPKLDKPQGDIFYLNTTEEVVLQPGDGAYVPVRLVQGSKSLEGPRGRDLTKAQRHHVVLPVSGAPLGVEPAPGPWDPVEMDGTLLVVNSGDEDQSLSLGDPVAGLFAAAVQTRQCPECKYTETECVLEDELAPDEPLW